MAQRGPRLRTAMSFLLLAACLAVATAKSYQKFLMEHFDYPMSNVPDPQRYCDLLMKRRNMATSHHCKHLNTFVHADTSQIISVCGEGGEPLTGDLRESVDSFPLTLCKLKRGSWAPDCRYGVATGVEKIVIACENGFPVHLETEIPN
ncbi:probable inactive ribonuclease-like protein 12 [Eublepharis macularius]|uniref:Probable inactive ribonuclease-like protein 12 n=1 Tax=Eublepharis macularius TaxID=481883 RepID=A0AA97KAF2_EUBMA|nr:probable inactive ribonuclease-like protein 12 [Eublepharis macularius]